MLHKILEEIPKHLLKPVLDYAYSQIEDCLLSVDSIYQVVADNIDKDFTIVDMGCNQAVHAWCFRHHKHFIGVDYALRKRYRLQLDNTKYYNCKIQQYVKRYLPKDYRKTFAICAYVPDEEARDLVASLYPNCLVYIPGRKSIFRHEFIADDVSLRIGESLCKMEYEFECTLDNICKNYADCRGKKSTSAK